MIDWMILVHDQLDLEESTLELSIRIMDQYFWNSQNEGEIVS